MHLRLVLKTHFQMNNLRNDESHSSKMRFSKIRNRIAKRNECVYVCLIDIYETE